MKMKNNSEKFKIKRRRGIILICSIIILIFDIYILHLPTVHAAAIVSVPQKNDSLSQGLVGYWDFEEGQGDIAYDKSGKLNHGTLTNMSKTAWTTATTTHIGGALNFDGVNDYVDVPNKSSQLITNGTLSLWAYQTNMAQGNGFTMIHKVQCCMNDSTSAYDLSTQWVSGNQVSLQLILSNGSATTYTSNNIPATDILKKWTHYTATFDGVNVKFYVNGVLNKSISEVAAPSSDGSLSLKIGKTTTVNGLIDDVRIYNRALSMVEIKRLYNMGR